MTKQRTQLDKKMPVKSRIEVKINIDFLFLHKIHNKQNATVLHISTFYAAGDNG